MESITALNEALKDFSGALLFTSQDHQFVQTTANRIMEITPNGLIDKECTYDEYLENDEAARKRQIVEIEEDDEEFHISKQKNTEILLPISVFFLINFPDHKYLRMNVLLHLSCTQ